MKSVIFVVFEKIMKLMARHCVARGNDRNYRWRNFMVRHPLITTVEEKSKTTSQMKCFLLKKFLNSEEKI